MTTPFPFGSGNTLTAAQMNAITTLPINDQTASYVALVGDVGKRIVMNVATANTVTINNSVFGVGDEIFIACKGAGATTVTAGAGVTINTASSLVLAQHGGGTLIALSASVFAFFSGGGANYGTATGGTALPTPPAGFSGMSFTTDGTLTVTKAGLFDFLLVGGGGGGGGNSLSVSFAGGGGAGGVTVSTVFLTATTYAIDVGAGGALDTTGSPSRIDTALTSLTATGGGRAGGWPGGDRAAPASGGCGGGGLAEANGATGAVGQQGFNGGNAVATRGSAGGGGGGGSANGSAGSGTVGGAGGAGYDATSFVGTSTTYAGGGGGGGASGGAGGSGGGGGRATNGTANTGGGGGGNNATGSNNAGSGGSGIVIVRFKV